MHKETDNIGTLVRDLDTLSIHHEISLKFEIDDYESDIMSPFIFNNEYDACLSYNDTHKIKIKSVYIKGFPVSYIPQLDKDTHVCNEMEIIFSDDIIITITIIDRKLVIYELRITKEDNPLPLLAYKDARVDFESFIFHETKSMVESLFDLIRNTDPMHRHPRHIQEYLENIA